MTDLKEAPHAPYRNMRAATNKTVAIRPVEYPSPRAIAALLVVVSAAADEVVDALELADVAMAMVLEGAAEDEVASAALAFLVPQSAASLQARWPSASLGWALMHWPKLAWQT